ncbi:MAG: hypothetical protein OEM25_04470, partial [Gammaproteobacteria bacterium]|nr:hypothetical protein [Gammaproteobacteria bacterium]
MKISGSYVLAIAAILLIGAAAWYMTGSVDVAQDSPTPASQAMGAQIEGSVLNVRDVPGYTYVEVEAEDGTVWAAAPSVPVRIGDTVSFSTGMAMQDFYSNTLGREFDVIYFVDRFISNSGTTSIDNAAAAAHGRMGVQEAVVSVEGIRKADGGYTIAEIFARGDDLGGQPVRVRGQVVKFTAGVMNTNWLRIRDGSTDQDLVAPTDASVAVNDVVLVEGKLVI